MPRPAYERRVRIPLTHVYVERDHNYALGYDFCCSLSILRAPPNQNVCLSPPSQMRWVPTPARPEIRPGNVVECEISNGIKMA